MYNYLEAVMDDAREYIKENIDYSEFDTLEELGEYLNETLWTEDSVTGNASGSYTFSSYRAQENLNGNWDLLEEVLEEFGYTDINPIEKGAEWCDVTIRCYYLSEAINTVLEEIEDDFDAAHEDAEKGDD